MASREAGFLFRVCRDFQVQDGQVLAERSIEGPEARFSFSMHDRVDCTSVKDLRLYKFEDDYWLSLLPLKKAQQ